MSRLADRPDGWEFEDYWFLDENEIPDYVLDVNEIFLDIWNLNFKDVL